MANIDRSSRQDKKKLAKLLRPDRLVALLIIGSIHSINQCMGILSKTINEKECSSGVGKLSEFSVSLYLHVLFAWYKDF